MREAPALRAALRRAWGRITTHLRLRRLLIAALAPLLIAGLGWAAARLMLINRWDPAYFSAEYLARYADPQETVEAAAVALAQADAAALAEMHALAAPDTIRPNPNLAYVFPYDYYVGMRRSIVTENPNAWDRMRQPDVRFASYLFADRGSGALVPLTVEQVRGRWVFVPPDGAYYYMQTGGWFRLWHTFSVLYYAVLLLGTVWVYVDRLHRSERLPR